MFSGNRRANYKVFDGEVEDCESNNDHGRSPPPLSHEPVNVSFKGAKDTNKSNTDHRWDHIENVDQFFTLVYEYHQGNGLLCIGLRQVLSLFIFIYVVCFSTFLSQCIDYGVLFNNRNTTTTGAVVIGKRHFKDALLPECASNFHPLIMLALMLATCFCLWQLVCIGYHLLQLREIKIFYSTALEIQDWELSNITWQIVVNKLCALQPKLHLIINQDNITPLDVYQRILRHKNYFVAFIYNDLLPARISLPFTGSFPFLSSGLRLNLEWLFFWGPWAPWKNSYALKSEYKDSANLELLAEKMRRTIVWISAANLLLFPFIFVYQTIFHFFSYADSIKREPGIFGTRKYAIYGRERLRHFNELDHELQSRLNRSYSFAVRYMDQFLSPVTEIIASKVTIVFGSIFAVLALLSAWDEDVLTMEHVLTVMTVCGTVAVICRSLIPNENLVYCQDFLMRQIVANIHYAPKSWLEEAHSSDVCKEFSQLFQLRAQCLLEELISPIITPFVLFFSIRPKASEFVLFFHNNTRTVDGLGDVCSYALMDISLDGDGRLASLNESVVLNNPNEPKQQALKRSPAFCGKVEMSLLNFATLNPEWVPPPAYADFISRVKDCTNEFFAQNGGDAPIQNSLQELDASVRDGQTLGEFGMHVNGATPILQPFTPLSAGIPTGSRAAFPAQQRQPQLERGTAAAKSQTSSSSRSSNAQNDASTTSMIASLSNMNPFMVSFAHANTTFQPRNIQENNSRALEMSFNAIALNRMLAANQPFTQSGIDNRRRLMAGGGYGAFGASQFRNGDPGVSYGTVSASRYGTGSTTASNLWGVPELSQPLLNEEGDDLHSNSNEQLYSP